MTFGKGMNIGEGKKYDISKISDDGITLEELKKLTKKHDKLIEIFKKFDIDGDEKLSKLELAKAMDAFAKADNVKENDHLSRKEFKNFAKDQELDVSARDLKRFLKTVIKAEKGDNMVSRADVLAEETARLNKQNEAIEAELKAQAEAAKEIVNNVEPEIVTTPVVEKEEVKKEEVETAPEEKTPTDGEKFASAFGGKRSVSAKIKAKESGLGDYDGQVRLAKGQTMPEDGSYPKTLRMTLPKSYGDGAAMTLTLVDEENGIYESSAHDRQFKVSVDEDGNVTMEAVVTEELSEKLDKNLEKYKRIREEKLAKEQEELERQQAAEEEQKTAEEQEKQDNKEALTSTMRDNLATATVTLTNQESQERFFHAMIKAARKNPGAIGGSSIGYIPNYTPQGGGKDIEKEIKDKINTYEAQLKQLEECKTQEELETKFKEIFGVPYDAEKIKNYDELRQKSVKAEAAKYNEDKFNKDMEYFLNGKYDKVKNTYSFPDSSYQTWANKLAGFIGGGDVAKGREIITQKMKELGAVDESKVSPDTKMELLSKYVKHLQGEFHKSTLDATDGVGYEKFNKKLDAAYTAAYGTKNNIAKEVNDYCNDLNKSAGYLKLGTTLALAVATGGVAGAAGVGLGATALAIGAGTTAVELTDQAFDGDGKSRIKEMTADEIGNALIQGGVSAAFVFAGGKIGEKIAKLCANQFAQQGLGLAADVSMGAGFEKLTTGEVTIEGTLFIATMSATGRLVSLVPANKAGKPKTPAGQKTNTKTNANETPAPKESTLNKATKQTEEATGRAKSGSVKVGDEKLAQIKAEINETVSNPNVTADELSDKWAKLKSLKEMKGETGKMMKQLDEAAAKLPPEQQAKYNAAKQQTQKQIVEDVFAGKKEFSPRNSRDIQEYVKTIDNPAELDALTQRLETHQKQVHGTKRDYDDAFLAIKNRKDALAYSAKQAQVAASDNHGQYSLDNLGKGKHIEGGKNGTLDHVLKDIEGVQSVETLDAIEASLKETNGIKAVKDKVKNAITEKRAQLQAKVEPKPAETPVEPKPAESPC